MFEFLTKSNLLLVLSFLFIVNEVIGNVFGDSDYLQWAVHTLLGVVIIMMNFVFRAQNEKKNEVIGWIGFIIFAFATLFLIT
ncbi:hypothetical protein [Halobacillus salinus]|uniref:Uncharacterized protein n=1 Tax=Halobacillus salinus TaxID=192814 RepID=A0A4Z0H2P0_9BACI|nr:hypothetical protein [Halobacillus salinus]TGB04134.1 hypothetical protein E4663_03760 [Halobacillus salinus]